MTNTRSASLEIPSNWSLWSFQRVDEWDLRVLYVFEERPTREPPIAGAHAVVLVFRVEQVLREIAVLLHGDPRRHEEYTAEARLRDWLDGGEGVEHVGEDLEDEVPAGGGSCEGDVLGFGAGFEEGVYCSFGFAELGWEGVIWEEF